MAENLKATHYPNGTSILQATSYITASDDGNTWEYWTMAPRWCYPKLTESYERVYGLQYTWVAANNVCPTGWKLPDTAYWFALGKLIIGNKSILNETTTRNTPSGGTETINEPLGVSRLGRYLKSDNGRVVSFNKYGDTTWISGGYWPHNDTLSNRCNGTGMSIFPAGACGDDDGDFGKDAFFWTPNYVHSDGSGQGRRAIYFTYENHDLGISWFHNANMSSVRCIKVENSVNTKTKEITSRDISIYPNPATNYLLVTGGTGNFNIMSTSGVIVKRGTLSDSNNKTDLSDVTPGVYILKVGNVVKKFIKK